VNPIDPRSVVFVTDATATVSDEWQRAACSYALTNIAELATADELVVAVGSAR
jgi:nicotinamidase-related amidase